MISHISARILGSVKLQVISFLTNISGRDVLTLLVGTVGGAIIYRFQYHQLHEIIFPLGGVDAIDISLNAPLAGAILGAMTSCVFKMSQRRKFKYAAVLSITGGVLVGSFFVDLTAYAAWQNESEGYFSTQDTILRAVPIAAFAVLWSLLLIAYGVALFGKSKQNLESL